MDDYMLIFILIEDIYWYIYIYIYKLSIEPLEVI